MFSFFPRLLYVFLPLLVALATGLSILVGDGG